MPSGLAGFKPSQSRLVNHPATIWRIDRGGKLDVQFGGLVDAHRGIRQRVVQYVTSLQSLIAGEVQMEADELDSRQAVTELQNPTIVPDIGGAIALRAVLLEDAAFANLLLLDAVTGSDWDRGLFALMLKHTEVFEALPDYAHRALVAAHMRNATQLGFRPGLLDELLEPWVGSDGQAAYFRQYSQLCQADTAEYEHLLGTISSPGPILWGRHDRTLPPEYAEWIAACIPDALLTWEENAGHLLAEDAPARLLAEILNQPTWT